MRESFLQPADPWRPQFHYSPRANWMNDPNGMVYFNGEYHLMYQYFPGGQSWGPMHWGHAVSRDLMHWEHRPVALYPDEFGMIFSGSAVVDWRDSSGFFGGKPGLVAVFTHHAALPDTREVRQSQSLAYSADGGRSWVKHKGNPVLTEPSLPDFRDPKVFWHEPEGRWIMALAAGDHIRFYASPNLREWTYTGEFGRREGSHQGVWECPDVFPLPVEGQPGETRWVLLVSIGGLPEDAEGSRTQYFLGTFRGGCFHGGEPAETVHWLDAGRDHYAGVTWSDAPDNRRILLGWMSNWKYAAVTPAASFRGAMTLPRELALYASGSCLWRRPPGSGKNPPPGIGSKPAPASPSVPISNPPCWSCPWNGNGPGSREKQGCGCGRGTGRKPGSASTPKPERCTSTGRPPGKAAFIRSSHAAMKHRCPHPRPGPGSAYGRTGSRWRYSPVTATRP